MSKFADMSQKLNTVLTGTHGETVTIYTGPDDTTGTPISARILRGERMRDREGVPYIADVIRIDRDQLASPPAESGGVSYLTDPSDSSASRRPIHDIRSHHGHWEVIVR